MLRYSAHLIIISAMVVASFAFSLFNAAPYQDLLDCTDSRECHLYSIIRPSEYDVSLKLFIPSDAANISRGEELTFDGVVSVKFNTTEKTTKLSFHASNLKFKSVKISCGEALPPTDAVYTVHSSSVTMHLAKELAAGSWCSIMFHYTGSMSDHIRGGLVKESISLTEGREKWIIFTGYKLFTAMPRTLFPCIDEPSYRANFLLELIHPSEMVAIASTPLRETMKTEYGWTYSIFEKTDKIPTYGVSFAVGHFKKIASQTTPKRTINTWIPYDIESTTLLDSTSTVAYIEQLESYLDVDYPSSKLDIVGLPQYYDRDFMCSSFRTPTSGIVFVAHDSTDSFAMVKKALARGWFGILTSPELWNDGFLSEGFATYIYTLGEHLSLSGKVEDMRQIFFGKDLLSDLQWATAPVKKNPVITDRPSCLTREMGVKSALILYMVQRIVGEEHFRSSVQKFLKAHSNSAVAHDDLYQLFTETMREAGSKDWCGHPLNASALLSPWLTQLGYPNVSLHTEADGRSTILSQTSVLPERRTLTWPIPIFLDNQTLRWIPPGNAQCVRTSSLTLNGAERELLRPSSLTYPVFAYDEYERTRIINMLSRDSVPSLSEADKLVFLVHHLLCDWEFCPKQWNFDKSDVIKVITKITETTKSAVILNLVERTFEKLRSLFLDTPYLNLWKEFGKSIFGRSFGSAQLTDNMNSSATLFMRAVLGYAIEFDVSDVRLQSLELFKTAYEQCTTNTSSVCEQLPLDPTLTSDVLCGAVKIDPSYAFPRLLEHIRKLRLMFPDSIQQQENAYYGLCCVENETMLEEYVREVSQLLGDPYMSPETSLRPALCLMNNHLASDVIASYLAENTVDTVDKYLFGLFGRIMTENWNSQERYDQLTEMQEAFSGLKFDYDILEQLDIDISLMKEAVKNNENERNMHSKTMLSHFRQHLLNER